MHIKRISKKLFIILIIMYLFLQGKMLSYASYYSPSLYNLTKYSKIIILVDSEKKIINNQYSYRVKEIWKGENFQNVITIIYPDPRSKFQGTTADPPPPRPIEQGCAIFFLNEYPKGVFSFQFGRDSQICIEDCDVQKILNYHKAVNTFLELEQLQGEEKNNRFFDLIINGEDPIVSALMPELRYNVDITKYEKQVMKLLNHDNPTIRVNFVRWLSFPKDLPIIKKALENDISEVRYEALSSVGLHDPMGIPVLIKAYNDKDPKVRALAVWNISSEWRHSTEIVPLLIRALNDPDEKVRSTAAERLTLHPNVEAIPHLEKALSEYSDSTASSIVSTFVEYKRFGILKFNRTLINRLCELMNHYNKYRRPLTLWLLVKATHTDFQDQVPKDDVLKALIEISQDKMLTWEGKKICIEALGDLGSSEAIPILLEFLQEPHSELRALAARAISEIGEVKSLFQMRQILLSEKDEKVKIELKNAIERIKNREQ